MRFATRSFALRCVLLTVLAFGLYGCKSDEQKIQEFMDRAHAFIEEGKDEDAIIELRGALSVDPQNVDVHYELAKAYIRTKNGPGALWELRETVRLDPGNDEAKRSLGGLALSSGNFEEALKYADEAIANDYSAADAYLIRAQALEGLKRIEEAERAFRAALDQRPDDSGYMMLLAGFYERNGDMEKSEELMRKILAADPDFNAYVALALFLRRVGDRDDEVIEAFDKALEFAMEGQKHLVYSQLAHYYSAKDEPDKVIETLQKGIEESHKSQPLIIQLTNFYRARGNDQAADELIQSVTEGRRPDNPEPHLTLSKYRSAKGDLEGALAAADAALGVDPTGARPRLRKAELLIEIGHNKDDAALYAEALKLIEAVLADEPTSTDARFVRGKYEIATGELEAAVASLVEVTTARPDWAEARMVLGSAQMEQGEWAAARASLARAIELDAGLLDARRLIARVHSELGEHEYAVEQARVYLRVRPGDASTRLLLAQNLAMLGRRDDAAAEIAAIEDAENDVAVLYALGKLAQSRGDLQEARTRLLAADAASPNLPEVLDALLEIDRRSGDTKPSIERIAAAEAADPENESLIVLHGRALSASGDFDGASKKFERAIELGASDPLVYLFLADVQQREGSLDGAIATFESAVKRFPKDGRILERLGLLYEAKGNLAKAKESYDLAIEADPKRGLSKNNLAYLLAEEGDDLERALLLAREAKELRPKDPGTADTLGWVLVKVGRAEEAVTYLREAEKGWKEDDPAMVITRHHLAVAYESSGSSEKAARMANKAVAGLDQQLEAARKAGRTPTEPNWAQDLRAMATRLESAG